MTAYYNENDTFTAAWLLELIKENLIAPGEVDTRSISDVTAGDLKGFTQHHFFAGVGGWSYALRLAGWPDDRPVWTGSCPCQPFSVAGKRKGTGDKRHLWPDFLRLISECKTTAVFGEQVASKDGRLWLAGVRADLEALGYAVGGADLCAASVEAPHIRQRLYWMADANGGFSRHRELQPGREYGQQPQDGCAVEWMADAEHSEWRPERETDSDAHRRDGLGRRGDAGGLANSTADGRQQECPDGRRSGGGDSAEGRATGLGLCGSLDGGLGNANDTRSQGRREHIGEHADQLSAWAASVFIPCLDGKHRRVPANAQGKPEPALFPLAHGVSSRVGKLRGSGNAIVPQVAAEFIKASMST